MNWSSAAWFVAMLVLALAVVWLLAAAITFVALWRGARRIDDQEMRTYRRLAATLDDVTELDR